MASYKRNIGKKLFFLRFLFVLALITSIFSAIFNLSNLVYFVMVVSITIGCIVVKDFIVLQDSFEITKYYFFGLIKKRLHFEKNEIITLSSSSLDFGQTDDTGISDIDDFGIGCLPFLFFLFFPPVTKERRFEIKKTSESGVSLGRVRIFLNQYEFNFLRHSFGRMNYQPLYRLK